MKRLLIFIAVLVVAGLIIGTTWNQTFPLVKDWVVSRPEAARDWYDGKMFGFRADKLMNCIEEKLTWTRSIGVTQNKTNGNLVIMIQLLLEDPITEDDWNDVSGQIPVIIACARYVPNWNEISIIGHFITPNEGVTTDGKPAIFYTAKVVWLLSMEKKTATLLLQADNPGDFLDSGIGDRVIGLTSFGFFGPIYQNLDVMDPKRVVEAASVATAWNAEYSRLFEERREANMKLTPMPIPQSTETPIVK
jgi:hypothetical protein